MTVKSIPLSLGAKSYEIHMGSGIIKNLPNLIPGGASDKQFFIVNDAVLNAAAQNIKDILSKNGAASAKILSVASGEQSKSFKQAESLCAALIESGASRKSIIIALGGGVIGDLAGFAAAITMRGIPFVQIPTTLLAMVDSSVGGKTGINIKQGKNMVGIFHQPLAVIADFDMLSTLSERECRAGYAEIVKYGLINDAAFFEWLEKNGKDVLNLKPAALSYAVEKSIHAKSDIVSQDEFETNGLRALLNLGHTFGHALETAAGYDGSLLHGEAVSIGMCMAFDFSTRLSLCPASDALRVKNHIKSAGLPIKTAYDPAQILDLMRRDKKSAGGQINLILARGIGNTFILQGADISALSDFLEHYGEA